jgi:quinolinate synthase
VLGHHYQRDEVIQFSDFQGDSWRLSELASQAKGQYIVFCGVHFMAESADILARPDQSVILPDLNAGCSMADMAEISQVEDAWQQFVRLGLTSEHGNGITRRRLSKRSLGSAAVRFAPAVTPAPP